MMQTQSKGNKFLIQFLTISTLITTVTASSNALSTITGDESRSLQGTISTPDFGACFNTENDQLKCTVETENGRSSCPSGQSYLKPGDISLSKCESPFRVEVGRCTTDSTDEIGSCTPFASSCQTGAFIPFDRSCSLVEDKSLGPDILTHYPFCQTKMTSASDTIEVRCVLSVEECEPGEEFLNFEDSKHLPHCFCADVPTGMCYRQTANEAIIAGTEYCAIGIDDCSDGYTFMPAYELSKLSDPRAIKCRICTDENIAKYELHEDVVESGGCWTEDLDYENCALENTSCSPDAGQTFQSSVQLEKTAMRGCHANIFPGGDCTTNTGGKICVHDKESCENPNSFVVRYSCTIFADNDSPDKLPMYFGKCQTRGNAESLGYRCVWQESECANDEDWIPASQPTDWYDGCKCEDVETGACRDTNGDYYCAVSDKGCAPNDTYVSSQLTKDSSIGLDCRLCQRSRTTAAPTASPTTSSPVQFDETDLVDDTFDTQPEYNGEIITGGGGFDTYPELDNGSSNADDDGKTDNASIFKSSDDGAGRFTGDQRDADLIVIIVGTIGGTLFFVCLGLLFWFQEPLPSKLYRTDEEVNQEKNELEVKGDMV